MDSDGFIVFVLCLQKTRLIDRTFQSMFRPSREGKEDYDYSPDAISPWGKSRKRTGFNRVPRGFKNAVVGIDPIYAFRPIADETTNFDTFLSYLFLFRARASCHEKSSLLLLFLLFCSNEVRFHLLFHDIDVGGFFARL